ncbi:MAG: ornithine cyclodeaminase family protein [Azospirillum sp.]|nr:ornithine cyclodeaminase family protein [Azospirillum sp.]
MRMITGAELKTVLHYRMLIERLRQMFRSGCALPPAHRHTLPTYDEHDASLILAPAWLTGRLIGIKVATVFPDNVRRDLPSALATYLLLDGKTGTLRALIDGPALTARRTAAASVLAASYLARPDSERLLVVGTGMLASQLIEAYTATFPIRSILVWGRNSAHAERVAGRFKRSKFQVSATTDLEGAVRGADIITCATATREPLIMGDWLSPGAHLDLIGGVTPEMREADDQAVRRARVFVDTRDGACREAGDIVQPLDSGVIGGDDIAGDLYELTRGDRGGRRFYDQITLFKSVGSALEDLAAAELAVEMVIHRETLR